MHNVALAETIILGGLPVLEDAPVIDEALLVNRNMLRGYRGENITFGHRLDYYEDIDREVVGHH